MDIDEKYKERLKYLKRFLKEHGVYTIFFKNVKERRFDENAVVRDFGYSWEEMVKSRKYIDNVIDASFIWKNTPQGHVFWSGLNNTFHTEYYEKGCRL